MQHNHQSVLLKESIHALNIRDKGIYVDATFGRGGHAQVILDSIGAQGMLIALDKDPEAVQVANQQYSHEPRFTMVHASFSTLHTVIQTLQCIGKIDGILFDLGVSSPQLDDASRGFSFLQEGPLDMRMDVSQGITAAQWLHTVKEDELIRVLKEYGEEHFARRIARAICKQRLEQPFKTTLQLAKLVEQIVPFNRSKSPKRHIHPATKTFQAIRIEINHELDELKQGLEQATAVLAPKGRLVVISFHSLEDRIVKQFIRRQARGEPVPHDLPIVPPKFIPVLVPVGKLIRPSEKECSINPRARSARLRVAEKNDV